MLKAPINSVYVYIPGAGVHVHLPISIGQVVQVSVKVPNLLHCELAQVRLDVVSRSARYRAPIPLNSVLAGIRDDNFNVCIRLHDNFALMNEGGSCDGILLRYPCCHVPMS